MLRSSLVALGIALALATPSAARAHGGPPVVETLSFDPSDPSHVLAGTNFGMMASDDRGASWSWICPGVVQLRPSVEDPLVLVSDQGSLLVGDTAGLWRGSRDACEWSSTLAGAGLASAGAIARGGPGVLFAGTSTDGATNTLVRSTTDGASWDVVIGPTIDVWFESVAVAPSDAQRVYAVQNRPPIRTEPWEVIVWRSDDGGDHWTSAPFTVLTHEWRLYLLGVDPTNPDRILAHTQNLYPDEHERVMLSEDGGTTWRDVLDLRQVLGGSWAPDGSSAYLAGPLDGLWRSDDGARTFTGIRTDLFLRCAVADATSVWVCADDFTDHFAIGRSTDRGVTFEPIAHLRSIRGQPTCAATTSLGTTCPAEQPTLDMVLASAPLPEDAAVADDASVPDDAGLDGALDASLTPAPQASCGCRAVRAPAGGGLAASCLVFLLALGRRRR